MRIKASIIVAIKALISQWKETLLMFAGFPLILALIMGSIQKDVFRPEVNRDKINIKIVDEDNSNTSKGFKELFESKELKEIFNITDKADYEITIPKDYENSLVNLKETTIQVEEKKRISRTNELIIRSVIEEYSKGLTEYIIISNKINSMSINDKEKLLNEVVGNINKISAVTALKQNIINGHRILTAFENQAATLMTFMVFTIIIACIAGFDIDKKNGSNKRLMSTPMTKIDFFNLDLFCYFFISFIYGGIYVLGFRISGLAFKGVNPLYILTILLCQSLLIASIAGFIIAYFGKNTANLVVVVFMYFHIIFGGGFIPLKDIDNKIFMSISRFSPGNVISDAYRNCILFNSFNSISKYLLIMLAVALAAYFLSIVKVKVRWEAE